MRDGARAREGQGVGAGGRAGGDLDRGGLSDWPDGGLESGLKPTLTPVGRAGRRTVARLCASPLVVAVFTVLPSQESPGATVPEDGSAEIEKSVLRVRASPTAVFQIVYAMPSALRFSAVAPMLAVVSQAEW
ncbi:hypothetical protein STENM327S_04752 [Streptomyces tendae]